MASTSYLYQVLLIVLTAVLISQPSSGQNRRGQAPRPLAQAYYGRYKLLRMVSTGIGQESWFYQFLNPRVDFWTSPVANGTVDFMVSPKNYRAVVQFLHRYEVPYKVLMNDVQKAIEDQFRDVDSDNEVPDQIFERVTNVGGRGSNVFLDWLQIFMRPFTSISANSRSIPFIRRPRKIQSGGFKKAHRMNWQKYHRLNDIYEYLYYLENAYPDLAHVINIGKTVEGRDMLVLKIGTKRYSDKPAIFLEAGIHAREWIAPSVATFIMRTLVENHRNNQDLTDFFDFYILPVANPDGYEYSFTSNRLWRKNRARNGGLSSLLLTLCDGVDLNRNFGYHWADAPTPLHIQSGTQLNCMETYSGPHAWSEPETRNIRDFVYSIQQNVVGYVPIHSYGQKILYPWSYTGVRLPDWKEMQTVGKIMGRAIEQASGLDYAVGSAPYTQYLAAGGADDWARGEMGIKWVFLIELPDTGTFGFLLPANKIVPTGQSVFEGIRALAVTISHKLSYYY